MRAICGRCGGPFLARAGVGLPDDDAVSAWDEACRLAAAARRIRERVEGGR